MSAVFVMRFLEVAMSSFLGGYALVIAVRYSLRWIKIPKESRFTGYGLLPLHVWTVSASYMLLLAAATAEIFMRIGHSGGPSWRSFVLIPAYILGVVAMITINRLLTSGRVPKRSVQKQRTDVK